MEIMFQIVIIRILLQNFRRFVSETNTTEFDEDSVV